jgi:hypothetical protein
MSKQLIFSFKEKYIKAALVERSGNSFDVVTGGAIEVGPGAIGAGAVINYDDVKEKLGSLIGGVSKAKSQDILILLSEEASFLKVLEDTKEKDFLKKPEAQEDIPYPLKGSFTTLRLLKNKGIQFAATPRDLISTYQRLFRDLGLDIRSIIPEPAIFLPFLEKATKPFLVISSEGESILLTVIFKSGVYFSITKHFKENPFDKSKLSKWIKEIVDQEIKTLSPTFDFEALVFGEHEDEILDALNENHIIAQALNIKLGKVNPQIGNTESYKKIIITAGLNKQIPGFHIKDVQLAKSPKAIQPPTLPRFNLRWLVVIILALIIAVAAWFGPKVLDTFLNKQELPSSTPAASPSEKATPSASPSAKKEEPKKATEAAKKKEEPKPILKRSSLKIEVLNGSGAIGAAGKAEELLKSKGYKVVSVGNASNYNFAKTEIRLKPSKADYLPLLTKDLSDSYTVIKGASLKESSSYDVQVIIGKK